LVVLFLIPRVGFAHDMDRPELDEWYEGLKMPDMPQVSCCGKADVYFCEEHSKGDKVYCVIDDDRDNVKLKRFPVSNGTVIEIPPNKINHDPNMEGRALVFMSHMRTVYCFIGAGAS
jgi:hypothetical protein